MTAIRRAEPNGVRMSETLIVACPTCNQKYRVKSNSVGQRARCKKCGQGFRVSIDQPIDDDTVLGWVMEEESASEQSVLGGTSIFTSPETKTLSRPVVEAWNTPPPPDEPRVRLERIGGDGAYFVFPASELRENDLRASFPFRCVKCVRKGALQVRLVLWEEKLPRHDSFHRQDFLNKTHGRLDQLLRDHQARWFALLEPLAIVQPPFCLPFPYFMCGDCRPDGLVEGHVFRETVDEACRLRIANLDIARRFLHNNGGHNTLGYHKLVEAAAQQRDNKWQRLPRGVRQRIAYWFRLQPPEKFLGYFSDADFPRDEAGAAGVILTDVRLVFKKYGTRLEFDVHAGGTLDIRADRRVADIHITQADGRNAVLHTNPLAASHLARALAKLDRPWKVKVQAFEENK